MIGKRRAALPGKQLGSVVEGGSTLAAYSR